MSGKLTKAQVKLLRHIEDHRGKLYGSRRDFPAKVARRDVVDRVWALGLIHPPAWTQTRTWELTPAGRAALNPLKDEEG